YPNNASLVIAGGFDPDKAFAKVKDLFGSLPKGDLPERKKNPTDKVKRPARTEFTSKFPQARMIMGFNGVASGDADQAALDVLSAVLSNGKTSRLYKKFIEGEEIASDASSSDQSGRYPGAIVIQVALLQGKDRAKAEELLLKELKRLRDEPV